MKRVLGFAAGFVALAGAVVAQSPGQGGSAPAFTLPTDSRTAIELPADVRSFFRYEMRGHLEQLDTLLARLSEGDFKAAAAFARDGLAVMGKHPPGAPHPGQFMPSEFRAMGQVMHQAAAEVAKTADAASQPPSSADWQAVMGAVSKLTATCAGCHGMFRIK
ncbi:MAG: hypothetical protein LCH61_13855 [Proteobacteria bacterium]|nr:hypothetical protein [Pseudomonadota bacterium]